MGSRRRGREAGKRGRGKKKAAPRAGVERPSRKASPPRKKSSFAGRFIRFLLIATVWAGVAVTALVAWYAYDLPDIAELKDAVIRRPSVTLLAADGTMLAGYGGIHGASVRLEELPPHLPHAVLATEDRRFYDHPGIDVFGILRALVRNVMAGEVREGGSTITQQLAKNLFLTRERTLRRKIQEALFAFWLESHFTKDEILTIYLNRAYFGAGAYGVEAAARRYFARSARDLSLTQAAVLAGLLKAPSRDNPIASPERAARRAKVVLAAMVDAGWLAPGKARAAQRERVVPQRPAGTGFGARYFADWVFDRIGDFVGYGGRDLVVRTTLDPRLQRLAESGVAAALEKGAAKRVGQAALVAMTPDGAVRAMVGGRDYRDSQFNRATQALRQPGSAFKLFVYLAAVESGLKPDSRVLDRPVTVGEWQPDNYSDRYRGEITLREGAARSSNSVAVALTEQVGREKVLHAARRLGITAPLRPDPSLALGADEVTLLELTGAYAAIANEGLGVWPFGITEIRDGAGAVLYRRSGDGPGRLVAAEHVAMLNDLLSAVVSWGTGRAAKLDRPAAGKTGTSQGYRDAWFVGYTPDLVAGIWLGNDDARPMAGVTGGSLPAQLWHDFMTEALHGRPAKSLPGVASDLAASR